MSYHKNIRTRIFIFLAALKNRLGILLMLGILAVLVIPGRACAANLTVNRTEISRGDTLVFSYDLSDLAESYDHAELRLEAWAGRNFFAYDPIPLQTVQGTCTFSNTDRGNWLYSYIVLLDSDGM